MRLSFSAITCMFWVATGSWTIGSGRAATNENTPSSSDAPQDFVVCTGWHALCTASPDCRVNGARADCDCMRVNETHIVWTGEIQDLVAKRLTIAECTTQHPCGADQAPICKVIADGKYEVDRVRYRWVSTYSYRGWCSILQVKPAFCDPTESGYRGDVNWAVCDAAPCTPNKNPTDPERPFELSVPGGKRSLSGGLWKLHRGEWWDHVEFPGIALGF
jgi:hypothetical protein